MMDPGSGEISQSFRSGDPHEQERVSLAKKETKQVLCLRVAVFAVLLITALIVSLGLYFVTRRSQKDEFKAQFEANADKIVDSFLASMERRLSALSALSTTITSYAKAANATFPNVTLPDFYARASDTRILSNLLVIFYLPLVTDQNRRAFEEYARKERQWVYDAVEEDYELRHSQDVAFGFNDTMKIQLDDESAFPEVIHHPFQPTGDEPLPEGNGPYLPIFQMSPTTTATQQFFWIANFLLEPDTSPGLQSVLADQKAVLDRTIFPNPVVLEFLDMFVQLGQYRHQVESHLGDPLCFMTYPVFDSFEEDRSLTGIVTSNLYWRFAFLNILPPNAKGYICVLRSSFNTTFTYRLDGPEVTFLGADDMHDPKFDYLEVQADVNAFLQERADPSTRSYTTVPFNYEYSRYTMHIYPAQETQDDFMNKDPIIFAIVVAAVFLFTSAVFITYDWLVEKRQRIVMKTAVQSTEVVNALFPQNVRDRLFEEKKGKDDKEMFLTDGQGEEPGQEGMDDGAIADLYHNCTVLFADLAGKPQELLADYGVVPFPLPCSPVTVGCLHTSKVLQNGAVTANPSMSFGYVAICVDLRMTMPLFRSMLQLASSTQHLALCVSCLVPTYSCWRQSTQNLMPLPNAEVWTCTVGWIVLFVMLAVHLI
jgi:hypothetical protein